MESAADNRGSDATAPAACFRLPLDLEQVGAGKHRSGWPFVMEHLRDFHHPGGVLLDDFVERTIWTEAAPLGWQEPWVGIFHHPPNLPEWLDPSAPIHKIISSPGFRASLPNLRGAVALSEYLGEWLRTALPCPVMVRKHPTEIPKLSFSLERWEEQQTRRIVQVGWYARNHRAIYQVEVPEGYRKIHLLREGIHKLIERTDKFSPYRDRAWVGEVEIVSSLDNTEFDELTASSLIFNEYWDVSASNAVIEAIARCIPLVVNRHPALEEYLGVDYPLFYDELRDVRGLLQDPARIRHAWQHLSEMDKRWLSARSFARDVLDFVYSVSKGSPEIQLPATSDAENPRFVDPEFKPR
jgi:hypothetical protein